MIFLFTIQIIIAILLIIIVLLQSSDEDALSGIGAGAGNTGLLSHKGSVDLITKVTIGLGILLICNSLYLAIIAKKDYVKQNNLMKDYLEKNEKLQQDNKQLTKENLETFQKLEEIKDNVKEEAKTEEIVKEEIIKEEEVAEEETKKEEVKEEIVKEEVK